MDQPSSLKPNAFETLMKKPSKTTQLRPGPLPKPLDLCSICGVCGVWIQKTCQPKSPLRPSPQYDSIDENTLFQQFDVQQAAYTTVQSAQVDLDGPNQEKVRQQISYTREQKLAAVWYSTMRIPNKKTGELEPTTKYCATQNLKITIPMLKN